MQFTSTRDGTKLTELRWYDDRGRIMRQHAQGAIIVERLGVEFTYDSSSCFQIRSTVVVPSETIMTTYPALAGNGCCNPCSGDNPSGCAVTVSGPGLRVQVLD